MLTKEFLKYRVRSGRAYPLFVDGADPKVCHSAKHAFELCKRFEGASIQNLYEEVRSEDRLVQAMVHLIVGSAETEEVEGLADQRWSWLILAEDLRQEMPFTSIRDFDAEYSNRCEMKAEEVKAQLYSDLPEMAKIRIVQSFTDVELVNRYNLDQVKGLLLRARRVHLTVWSPTTVEMRFLFRMMKFHQLVADVLTTPKGLEIEISGSLDIFGVSQASFGRSVAKFLGYVTKLKRWKLQAEISLKGKSLSFVVDQKTQLISDHSVSLEYVPEEVSHFIDQMQSMLPEWQIISAPEVLNLGAQVYCIPDFSLKGPDGRFHHIELFHRFHQGQLRSRVERWIENPIRQLVLGVSTKVTRDAALTALLDKAKNMGLRSFEFRDFPSARAAMPLIVGESAG